MACGLRPAAARPDRGGAGTTRWCTSSCTRAGRPCEGRRRGSTGAADPVNQYGHDVLWWLDRMVRGRHPLVERMTFNWHDHWATSNDKVGDVKLMMRQQRTLRRYALGNFRTLARAMVRDGAMQIWLDLAGSSDEAPNENFAREFFELFTLGANNGYTEKDIREAARALDGLHLRLRHQALRLRPEAPRRRHQAHPRPRAGGSGRSTSSTSRSRTGTTRRTSARSCGATSPPRLPAAAAAAARDRLHASRLRGRAGALPILADGALYADLDEPDMVKPPFVYVGGHAAPDGHPHHDDDWVWMLDQMGQRPFYPPNVSGWERNEAWLSTSSLRMRFQAAASCCARRSRTARSRRRRRPRRPSLERIAATGRRGVGSAQPQSALPRYAACSVAGRDEKWEVKHYWPERERVLRQAAAGRPRRAGLLMPPAAAATGAAPGAPRSAAPARSCRSRRARARRAGRRSSAGGLSRRNLLERRRRPAGRGRGLRRPLDARRAGGRRRAGAGAPDATILVSLYLDGGNDGLNTLVPLGDPRYAQLRSRIGVDPATALPLAGDARLRLAPLARRAARAVRRGQGRGAPGGRLRHPDQSHFNSGGYWRSGIVGPVTRPHGLARPDARRVGTRDNPLQGISVGWGQDPSLNAAPRPRRDGLLALRLRLLHRGRLGARRLLPTYRRRWPPPAPSTPGLAAVRSSTATRSDPRPARAAGQGGRRTRAAAGGLPRQRSRQGARQSRAHARRRLRHAHRRRLERRLRHPRRAGRGARRAAAGPRRLAAAPGRPTSTRAGSRAGCSRWSGASSGAAPRTTTPAAPTTAPAGCCCWSATAPTAASGASSPGSRLDEDDNLVVTTEFRSVYATLLEEWLGVEAARVLPKIDAARLPLVK